MASGIQGWNICTSKRHTLHNLSGKNNEFTWSEKCQNSFQRVREYLCAGPVLAIFNPEASFSILTDGNKKVGVVLKQPPENEVWNQVFCFSRKLVTQKNNEKANKLIIKKQSVIAIISYYFNQFIIDWKYSHKYKWIDANYSFQSLKLN